MTDERSLEFRRNRTDDDDDFYSGLSFSLCYCVLFLFFPALLLLSLTFNLNKLENYLLYKTKILFLLRKIICYNQARLTPYFSSIVLNCSFVSFENKFSLNISSVKPRLTLNN